MSAPPDSHSPGTPCRDLAERKARLLVLPSILIVIAAVLLLPWLLETERRLQNDHWEGQIWLAFTSLAVAASGVPFVILRLFRRVPVLCLVGWGITISGYFGMLGYMIQSHTPAGSKLLFSTLGIICLRWSVQGLILDAMRSRPAD